MNINFNNTVSPVATEFEAGMSRYDYYKLLESYDYTRFFPEVEFDEMGKSELGSYMKNTMTAGKAAAFEKKYFKTTEQLTMADEKKWWLFELSYKLSNH